MESNRGGGKGESSRGLKERPTRMDAKVLEYAPSLRISEHRFPGSRDRDVLHLNCEEQRPRDSRRHRLVAPVLLPNELEKLLGLQLSKVVIREAFEHFLDPVRGALRHPRVPQHLSE